MKLSFIFATLIAITSFADDSAIATPEAYGCGGTEPFWALSISGDKAELHVMGNEGPEAFENFSLVKSMNNLGDRQFSASKSSGDQISGWLIDMEVERASCSDGMSDYMYPYKIVFSTGGHLYSGCCSSKQRPKKLPEGY